MDEATIKQMMQEYKRTMDKAKFIRELVEISVVELGKTVESEDMITKFCPKNGGFSTYAYLDYK